MRLSTLQQRGPVPFPTFDGERVYMRPFRKRYGLPADLARWQATVDAMLDGIDVPGDIYLMVDQRPVAAGKVHRRPGVHTDGAWVGGRHQWHHRGDLRETVLLAASVPGARAYVGPYFADPMAGGDCSHIDVAALRAVDLAAHAVYALDAMSTLHETVPVTADCLRTVVRLHLRDWSPHGAGRDPRSIAAQGA